MPAFEIFIDEEGKATVRATGFKGPTCLKEAEKLNRLLKAVGLDIKTEKLTMTDEAHTSTTTQQQTGA